MKHPPAPFSTVKFKTQTAERFREFSRSIAPSHTDAMDLILNFFESSRVSPADDLGPNMKTLEANLKKRINSLIAILRDIEKTQTKPTLAMIQLLFQESPAIKNEILVEKKLIAQQENPPSISSLEQENRLLRSKLTVHKENIKKILDTVVVNRSSFGKVYLRLQLSKEEFDTIKSKLQ